MPVRLRYSKIREVKSPLRGHPTDAGIDFFIPDDYADTIIEPNTSVLIPSGIKVQFDHGWALVANNKSGIASKKGLLVGAQVIDSSYQGEVHINLHNVSSTPQLIKAGDKIVQFVMYNIGLPEPEEVPLIEYLYFESSDRGDGGFGSTGV
jgi:dUTP pyrophosphatase